MESEVIRNGVPNGLKPLTLPAYSVVVSEKQQINK
jgi:hypothetical protein